MLWVLEAKVVWRCGEFMGNLSGKYKLRLVALSFSP